MADRSTAPPAGDPAAPRARRWSRLVLIISGAFLVVSASLGLVFQGELVGGGIQDPEMPATRASDLLLEEFPGSRPNMVMVVRTPKPADDLAMQGVRYTERMAGLPKMLTAQSYWTTQDPRLLSRDGRAALIVGVSAMEPDLLRAEASALARDAKQDSVEITLGGVVETNRAIEERTSRDLLRTEAVALPLLLVVLLFAFRGVLAAILPIGMGLLSIAGSLMIVGLLGKITDVSVFSLNVCTALGLGLAVDYSLLILSRFREELGARRSVEDAIAATMRTAGRTVAYSAVIVGLSLSSLLIFPQYFLRSFAYAGLAVVALNAVSAQIVLPALLRLLGRRLTPSASQPRRAARATSRWYRWAAATISWRIPALGLGVAVLMLLAAPVLGLRPGLPDDRQLPASSEASRTQQALRTEFAGWAGTLDVVIRGNASAEQVQAYAATIAGLPGVTWVEGGFGVVSKDGRAGANPTSAERFTKPDLQWLSVAMDDPPESATAHDLVQSVRALPPPAEVLVGGAAADIVDTRTSIQQSAGWAALILVATSSIVLFSMTGSLLIPLKALALNVLSLGATFGVLTWGFQEGWLRGIVGDFQLTGYLDYLVLVLVAGVAFALAMDYEVFLLARVQEEHLAGASLDEAIRRGLQHTGGIITVAAALICVVFVGLASSVVFDLKVIGTGLFVGLVIDATLVRCVLVPAFLSLAGRANWWAPSPLRWLHRRIAIAH